MLCPCLRGSGVPRPGRLRSGRRPYLAKAGASVVCPLTPSPTRCSDSDSDSERADSERTDSDHPGRWHGPCALRGLDTCCAFNLQTRI